MVVEYGEFKGNKMITLKRSAEDKYPMSFGLSKATLITANIEDIKKFVAEGEQEKLE